MTLINRTDNEARSDDMIAKNIETLKGLFPDAVSEGKLDLSVLKGLIGAALLPDEERDEKYGLNWFGKRKARQIALTPSNGTLRPCIEDSVDWDTTKNLMIEGDNLEVLKLLQKSYAGQVKLIYIDPPYNTGKDFVYPDNFQDSIKNYLELTGQIEGGAKMQANTEASGRFHTDWLNMMYPRLRLAKNLLKPDGVLFISIDDNEVSNLKALCSEIFGLENFIALLPTIMNLKGNNDEYGFAGTHEYTLVFTKDKASCKLNDFPLDDEEQDDWEEDDIGPFKKGANLKSTGINAPREKRPNLFFPLYIRTDGSGFSLQRTNKSDIEIYPRTDGKEMSWRWSKDKFLSQPKDVMISIDNGSVSLYKKQRPQLGDLPSKKPKTIFYKPEYSSGNGTAEVKQLLGDKVFNSPPKPLRLIRDFIIIGCNPNDLVLDITAGSGTTGHAVFLQNAHDGGTRRWILIQLPEPIDKTNKEQISAFEFLRGQGKALNIAEITKERLRRASAEIRSALPMYKGDIGFRVFKLDTSNILPWEPEWDQLEAIVKKSVDHIKDDRTEADILYELFLKLGLDLAVPIEQKKIASKKVYSIGAGTLIVCLDKKINRSDAEPLALGIVGWHKELAPVGETTCVFLDSGFVDDVAKTNLSAILNQYGLANVRSL